MENWAKVLLYNLWTLPLLGIETCACGSHEELVTGLASSEVQLTGTFLKKQLTSKVRLAMSLTVLSFWLWEGKQENHMTYIFVRPIPLDQVQ